MTPAEAAVVLGWAAAIDAREKSEMAATAWAGALDPRVTVADAKWIITDHYKRETWKVMPAHINERYKAVRHDRTKDTPWPDPPSELDGHTKAEIEWRRTYMEAIADGLSATQADAKACAAVSVTRAIIEAAPRPVTAMLTSHKGTCSRQCGCLTRPIRPEEKKR